MRGVWLAPIVSLLIIFGLFMYGQANASEPQRWVGVPVFYSKFVPKQVKCSYQKDANQGTCGIESYADVGTVGLTTAEADPKIEEVKIRLYMEVTCVNHQCRSPYGEPAGIVALKETSYWTVPTGFYLYSTADGVTAYKAGNGPLAKDYPIRNVWLLPEYNDVPDGYYLPEESNRLNFQVWCNVADECSYMGKEINYIQLKKYVPKRLSALCDERFCYDPQYSVIGLNPKRHEGA